MQKILLVHFLLNFQLYVTNTLVAEVTEHGLSLLQDI